MLRRKFETKIGPILFYQRKTGFADMNGLGTLSNKLSFVTMVKKILVL
jgi:hypothetical protein